MAEVVFLEGGDIGGAGSFTGEVLDLGAGGGSGAEGSWIGAVDFFDIMGTTDVVLKEAGIPPVAGETGEVDSRGWVTPAPGRPRSVMRTVSFFSGTAAVLGVEPDGGVGGVFSDSLMVQGRKIDDSENSVHLANFAPLRQSLSPDALQLSDH